MYIVFNKLCQGESTSAGLCGFFQTEVKQIILVGDVLKAWRLVDA